jgi:beta-lactamase superfamily II metal-dependent hydrolase
MPSVRRIPRVLVCCLCAMSLFLLVATDVTGGAGFTVSFIDVGQGDAALLHDPAGCNVLIDGGRPSAGPTVVSYLNTQGVSQIDAMIATHADSDHIGGLIDVLQAGDISVTQVLYNGRGDASSSTWNSFVGAVVAKGLTLTVAHWPMTYTWCAIQAQVLNPSPLEPYDNDNDASVVLLAQHDATRYLFTGDISSDVDVSIIQRTTLLPIDVLKVSHHGSAYASSAAFLSLTHPRSAVISVGPNSYGHPAAETLTRLTSIGALTLRTDLSGTITLHDSVSYTHFAYLPVIAAPTTPMPGYNVRCVQNGNAQMCASVSAPTPGQNTSVTVYGRLLVNGTGQAGLPMSSTWKYKSTTPTCNSGITGADGVASCGRQIGAATLGYTVNITASIGGYTASTSFTPQ